MFATFQAAWGNGLCERTGGIIKLATKKILEAQKGIEPGIAQQEATMEETNGQGVQKYWENRHTNYSLDGQAKNAVARRNVTTTNFVVVIFGIERMASNKTNDITKQHLRREIATQETNSKRAVQQQEAIEKRVKPDRHTHAQGDKVWFCSEASSNKIQRIGWGD